MKLKIGIFIVAFLMGIFGVCLYGIQEPKPKGDMLVVNFFGGLGNNMFQYATGIAYAQEHNRTLLVNANKKALARFEKAFGMKLDTYKFDKDFTHESVFTKGRPIDFLNNERIDVLYGYFQHEGFFKKYEKQVRKALKFNKNMSDENKDMLKKIKRSNSVSIHVRRGDYIKEKVYYLLTPYYYKKAAEYIARHVKNPEFFVFSDEIDWARENIKLPWPVTYVDFNTGDNSFNDMRLMSHCKHNIIANSTFSWWGAYLNDNPDKIVVAPSVWHKTRPIYENEIVPPDWIRISDIKTNEKKP